jgi:hypothetical protein
MKRKPYSFIYFLLVIIWGLNSCGGIQIVPEEKPAPKQIQQDQQEKTAREKLTPKEAPSEAGTKEKNFLEKIFPKIAPRDTFTRIYPVDFRTFHPPVLSSLQEYSKANKGNSFQVQRLGSEDVLMRGVYQGGKEGCRFIVNLTLKPVGSKKSSLEIKITPDPSEASTDMEKAGKSLFQIIEKGTGFSPVE